MDCSLLSPRFWLSVVLVKVYFGLICPQNFVPEHFWLVCIL
uniref:Uncharacterized protein n=1 Tax=Anguilla anguilla TaxID=7936 RepID=A0A0E9RAM6_ANGAN